MQSLVFTRVKYELLIDKYVIMMYNICWIAKEVVRIAHRIAFTYPNGKNTYGLYVDDGDPHFEFMNQRYEIKDIAETGAVAVVNNPDLLRALNQLGMPCRPTSRQHVISISVQEETKLRLKAASEKTGRSVSNILEGLAIQWLDENDYR